MGVQGFQGSLVGPLSGDCLAKSGRTGEQGCTICGSMDMFMSRKEGLATVSTYVGTF